MENTEKTKRTRSKTTRNVFEKKDGVKLKITSPALRKVIGDAERCGAWLIYGADKQGKTQLALRIAKDLAKNDRVAYISAEEGLEYSFRANMKRAGIIAGDKILWDEYIPFDEVIEKFKKPRTANIIIIDNLTVYEDEIPKKILKQKIEELTNKIIIFVAHEERGVPSNSVARMAAKWAKVTIRVRGLTGFVISRYPDGGGTIAIDRDISEQLGFEADEI